MNAVTHAVTKGIFSLDGETHEVENNVWIVGDDKEVVVIDAPHDVEVILAAVDGRSVKAIICTHAHDDHVRVAPELSDRTGAPIWLHPDDEPVWELTHPDRRWDEDLSEGTQFTVGGIELLIIHTPGHAPGAVCIYAADLGCLFSGDTLFKGGPGATGRSFSDEDVIKKSIRTKLFALPEKTTVHTGHGPSTTIAAEADELGR